jgi:hypothetical protein
MELGQKDLDMFNKQKDRQSPMGQVKVHLEKGIKAEKSRESKKQTSGKISAKTC